jgi:hypothetical protein
MTRNSSTTKKTQPNLAKLELKKLKSILPTLKQKPTSTPIEIVLETIRYIRQLEDQLIDRSLSGRKQTYSQINIISFFQFHLLLEHHYPICQLIHHYYKIFPIQTDHFTYSLEI